MAPIDNIDAIDIVFTFVLKWFRFKHHSNADSHLSGKCFKRTYSKTYSVPCLSKTIGDSNLFCGGESQNKKHKVSKYFGVWWVQLWKTLGVPENRDMKR